MTEIPILTKFFISFTIFFITVIGIYLGLCVLKLSRKNEQLQRDRNNLIESRSGWELEMIRKNLELSDTEKKLIYIALTLPALKKEIKAQGLTDVLEFLRKKIKDSISV